MHLLRKRQGLADLGEEQLINLIYREAVWHSTMRVSSITFLRGSGGVKSHNFGSPEAATKSKKSLAFVHRCIVVPRR